MYALVNLVLMAILSVVSPKDTGKTAEINRALQFVGLVCKGDFSCAAEGDCSTNKGLVYYGISPKGLTFTADYLEVLLFDTGKKGRFSEYADLDTPTIHYSIDTLDADEQKTVQIIYDAGLNALISCAEKSLQETTHPTILQQAPI